jgi:hypothetical protein
MGGENQETPNEIKIARSIEELPKLKEDFIRIVHLTNEKHVEGIIEKGLNYENQGMAMATASAWSKEEDVEYSSEDPRFSGVGIRAVVMDLPNDEWKLHNNITKSPGVISNKYIVGVIDPNKITT